MTYTLAHHGVTVVTRMADEPILQTEKGRILQQIAEHHADLSRLYASLARAEERETRGARDALTVAAANITMDTQEHYQNAGYAFRELTAQIGALLDQVRPIAEQLARHVRQDDAP